MPPAKEPSATATVRVAFWNTWLLAPRLGRTGPRLPGLSGWFAPDVDERAPLVARAAAANFDVAALSEVWDPSEQLAVAQAWPEARYVPGPGRPISKVTGSGLGTFLGPAVELVRTARYGYRSGGDLRDSDWFAKKGALFTSVSVHPDLPPVEVISTHLFAGGELFPVPGAEDPVRHHEVRMEQLDELVGFIERMHDPGCTLLVVGDFNIPAHDGRFDDPTAHYRDLAAHLARAELVDVWAAHGVGPGPTCTFTDAADLPPDPDEPDLVVDDPGADPAAGPGERIDYLWLHTPSGTTVEVERPRRWAFSGRGVQGGPAGSLSDHLALSVTLHLS